MDNKKNDGYYIDKIKNDLVFINNHVSGKSYEEFLDDEVLQDSMMFRLVQISENSKNLSGAFKKMHEDIPWTDVYGLRNRIVHEYGYVDMRIIFDTLINDIPDFLKRLCKL